MASWSTFIFKSVRPLFLGWDRVYSFETAFLTLKSLDTIEVHYVEKNPGMFSLKKRNFFATEERQTWASWMTWGRVSFQDFFIQEVDFSIKLSACGLHPKAVSSAARSRHTLDSTRHSQEAWSHIETLASALTCTMEGCPVLLQLRSSWWRTAGSSFMFLSGVNLG